jgi:hypothetical protein
LSSYASSYKIYKYDLKLYNTLGYVIKVNCLDLHTTTEIGSHFFECDAPALINNDIYYHSIETKREKKNIKCSLRCKQNISFHITIKCRKMTKKKFSYNFIMTQQNTDRSINLATVRTQWYGMF